MSMLEFPLFCCFARSILDTNMFIATPHSMTAQGLISPKASPQSLPQYPTMQHSQATECHIMQKLPTQIVKTALPFMSSAPILCQSSCWRLNNPKIQQHNCRSIVIPLNLKTGYYKRKEKRVLTPRYWLDIVCNIAEVYSVSLFILNLGV